jgi:putative transposase
LKPTKQQEEQLRINADCARYAYNWTVALFKEWQKGDPHRSSYDLAKQIRVEYNSGELAWLKRGSSQAIKQAVYDAHRALLNFFRGNGFPKFKSKHRTNPKFFVPVEKVKVDTMRVNLPKLGWVVTAEQLPRKSKFSNPRVSHDGKYWYLAVGEEHQEEIPRTKGKPIGVDIGIKTFVTVSDGRIYPNIAKSKRAKMLAKKLKRVQRKQARRYRKGESSQNYRKVIAEVRSLHRRIANLRNNHCHQVTADLVRNKPSVIVIEDLNTKGMMKNHRLARAIAEVTFAEFRRQVEYKSEANGIEIMLAGRFFASSKMCSACGSIKEKLSLGERIYKCECGLTIDRDLNAAINLAKLAS